MKVFILCALVLSLTIGSRQSQAQLLPHPANPQILSIVEQISADTLLATITRFTQFHTRHTFSDTTSDSTGIGAAMRWVQAKGESYDSGGNVSWEWFPWTGNFGGNSLTRHDLIARRAGAAEARGRYVIGGHFDSRTVSLSDNTGFAPGADDNGSSCAALLEMLRLLPDSLVHDLELVWFTGEEQGLWGSAAYANYLSQHDIRVDGMIAMDMIGHIVLPGGGIDSTSVRLYAQGPAESASRGLQRYLKWVGEAYAGEENFEMVIFAASDRPGRGSDHLSFSGAGYPALRVIERNEDLNYQHNSNDVPQNMSPTYARHVAMCTYGGLLTMLMAPPRPPEVTVTTLVPGQSYQIQIPDSAVLPEGGRFYLAIREYTHSYFDTLIDMGESREYIDSLQVAGAVVGYSYSREDANGLPSPFSDEVTIWFSKADETPVLLPSDNRLSSFPNPFNNETTLRLEVVREGHVTVDIFDLNGRHVAKLLDEDRALGVYQVPWSPASVASGIYLARLTSGADVHLLKLAYLR